MFSHYRHTNNWLALIERILHIMIWASCVLSQLLTKYNGIQATRNIIVTLLVFCVKQQFVIFCLNTVEQEMFACRKCSEIWRTTKRFPGWISGRIAGTFLSFVKKNFMLRKFPVLQ